MQEEKRPIDRLLEVAKKEGYSGDAEHLSGLISNNPDAAERILAVAQKEGYTGDMEHFVTTFGVQEGNVEATADGGEESQAPSDAEQTTEEFVMPEIQQATQESVYDAIQESQKTELEKITGAVESKLTEEAAASRSEEMGKRIKDNVLSITPENVEDFYKTFGIEKDKTDHSGIMRVDMPWEVIGDMEPDEQSAMLQQLALYNNPELLKKYKGLSDAKREEYNYEKYGTTKSVTEEEAIRSLTTYDVDSAKDAGEVSKMNLEEKMAHFDKEKAEVLNEAIEALQKDANASTVSELVASLEGQGIDVSKLNEDELQNLEARLNVETNGSFDLNEDSDAEQREDATFLGDAARGFGSGVLNIYAGFQQIKSDITGNPIMGAYAYRGAKMADELRGEMTQYLTSLSDDVGNKDIGRLAERTVVMLGESAPLMLVAAAAGAVTGGTGAGAVATLATEFGATAGVSMLGTYGDTRNEEWFNELSGVEKLGYVAETGVAEGLPAVIGARIFKHAFKTAAPSYSAFVANRSAQNLGKFLGGAVKSTFLGMLEEGTTEGLTGVWQASADSRYKRAAIENQLQDPNLSTEERNQLQAEYESLEFTMEGAKEAFIEGGLGGILLGGGMSTLGTAGRSAFTEYAFMKQPELKAILNTQREKVNANSARIIASMDSETRAALAKVAQTLQLIQEAEGRGDVEAAKQLQKQMAEELKLVNATVASRQEFYSRLDEDKRMDLAALYTKLEAGARALKNKDTKDSEKSSIRKEIAETVKAINDFRAENDIDVDGRSDVDFIKDINLNIDAVALYGNIAPESGNADLEGDIETELLQAAETVLGRGKLDQDARDAIQALADVAGMKGGPVRLHYTRESYGKDVGVENAASTNGFFRTEDGTVHIFAPTMTRTTAYHETIHRIAGEDLESSEAGKALGAMLESMPAGVANLIKRLAAINMRAKGVSFDGQLPSVEEIMADSDIVDEVLTEFLAKVSSGEYNVDYRRGFRQGVIKMIDGLTGGKLTPVNRRRIQHMRINQAVDAFNMVRDAFRDSDTEGVKAGIQQLADIKEEAAPVSEETVGTTVEEAPEVEVSEDTTEEGKPQLESMDVDSIDNQNEQEAGSMFMGEFDMRRGKPQLAMGDLDYAIQPSHDPDTYLEVYNEDDLPEELRLSMPDPVELESVLNKSKGAAVFINSDGTKVGVVRGQNIQGGYRYVFLNEAQEAKAGFASTSKTHVGVMHKLVQQLDDARKPEDKGAPVAVFVTIQAADTMTGEWYSAKYVADGIAEILEKGMLTEEQVLDALVDAYVLGEADTAAKRPAKKAKVLAADLDVYNAEVEKAKEKAMKELAKDGIAEPTEEQINDTYPMHMSKDAQVGFIVREIAKGSMDSERVQELFTSKMTFGGRVSLIGNTLAYVETNNPLSNALLELGYTKMEFFREYMDEAPLAMFEKALAADKKKESKAKYERAAGAITGMVMGGFYADPSLNPEVAKENAKGRVEHQQFDTAFTSNGEVFRLNKPYNVDTLQFRIGAPTKQGVSFYNEHAGADKYYKGTDKKDIMASVAPSDVSKVESLVEGGMSVRQAVQSIGYVEYARKHRQGVSDFIMEAAVGSAAPETKSRYGEFVVAQKGDDVRAMSKLMTSPYGNVSISAYPSGIIKLQSDMVERLGSESKAVGESIIEAYNSMDKGEQTAAFEAMFKSQEKMIPFSGQGLVEASQKGEAVQQLREKLEAAPEGKKQVGDVDMLGDLVESMYNGWTASEARTMLKEFGFSKTQVDELMRLAQQRLRGRREGIREEYRSRIEERKEARKNSTLATNLQAKLDAERLAGKTRKEATSIIIKLISEVLKEQGIKGLKPQHILQMMAMVAKPTRASKNKLNGDEAADFQEKIIERIMQLESELTKGRQAAEVLAQFKKDVAKARELQRKVRRMQNKKHRNGGIHLAYKQGAMMLTSVNAAHLSPAEVAGLVDTLNSLISTQKTGVIKGEVRDRSSVEAINTAAKNFQAQNVQFNAMADLRRAERMAKRENAKRKQQNRAQVTVQEMMDKLYADRHMAEIKRARTTLERLADERGIDISTPEALAKFEEEVMEELFAKNQERIEALAGSVRNLASSAQYQLANNDSLSKIYGEDINARIDQLASEGDYSTLAKLELVLYNAAVNNSFADIKKLASDMHYRFHSMPKLKALMKSGKIKVRKRGSGRRALSALDTMDSALSMIVIADKRALSQVREALGLTSLEIGFARAKSAFDSLIDGGYGDGAFPGLVGLLKKAGVDMNQMTKTPFSAALQAIATLEQKPQGYDSVEWASDLYKAMEKSIGQASIQVDKYSKSDVKEMRENILDVYEEGMTMEEYSEALVQKHPKSREIITAYRTVHQRARARWGYDSFYEETLGTQPEMGENYTPFSFSRVLKSGVEDNSMAKIVQDRMTGNVVPSDKESKTSTSKERKRNAIKGVVSGEFVMDLDFHSINTGALWSNSAAIFASDSVYEARSIMGQQVSDGTQTLPMSEADAKMMLEFIEQYSNPSTNGRNMVFQKKYKVHGVEFSNPLYYAKKAAVVKAFGSLFGAQILKQSSVGLSVLAQTTHMSSKSEFVEYVALMSAMSVKKGSTNMNKIMPDAMKRMLMENSPVFQRDYESALVDSDTSGHVSFDENYLDIVSDKLSNVSLAMLKGTDKVMAAASWFAFYSDYIRSEEGRDVNWEEESKNPNADAVGHANRMVSKDQAASTARQAAQLYSTKSGAVKFFLDTIMPFSRFGINKKRSIVSDVIKLMHAPTAEAKREAASALAGHFSEMYAFATIGSFVIPAIAAAVLGDEDEIPEFFSTKQQLTIVSRVIKDVALPMNLEVTDALAVNEMNKLYYGAFVRDEYTEGMTDSQAEKAYEDWLRRNGASVFISKDDIKKNPLKYISGIMGPAGSWAYDASNSVRNLKHAVAGDGKYVKPNGDVVYIDPDFQDRAATTSMLEFGMMLGQFAGLSSQEVGKLTRMYDDAHIATSIKRESDYLYRLDNEGLLGDLSYYEALQQAGLLDNVDDSDFDRIDRSADAVYDKKLLRDLIVDRFGKDFYMDHAEELVYDAYLSPAGIAEIFREEDAKYVEALKLMLSESKLDNALHINRKRNE